MKHMVFIEGVSGVGKSTAVKQLTERLLAEGFQAAAHYEGDADSPLDLCWVAYLTPEEYAAVLSRFPAERGLLAGQTLHTGAYCLIRYRVNRVPLYSEPLDQYLHSREFCYRAGNKLHLSVFTEVFSDLWRSYIACDSVVPDYEIFDASLVSHMTNDLIRGYHAEPEDIASHLSELLGIVRERQPVIFYLYTDNVSKRVTEARHSRKQPPLTEEKLRFWEKRMQMDRQVLPRLQADIHYIDVSQVNWGRTMEEIYQRLMAAK